MTFPAVSALLRPTAILRGFPKLERGVAVLVAAGSTAAALVAAAAAAVHAGLEEGGAKVSDRNHGAAAEIPPSFQIEVSFMEKLASKPYLQSGGPSQLENDRRRRRPTAVPPTLRVLTVDLPEAARTGFRGGPCRRVTSAVFPDGVAPPRRVEVTVADVGSSGGGRSWSSREPRLSVLRKQTKKNDDPAVDVEQLAWVQSLFHCYQNSSSSSSKVGVEIMEARTDRLNPLNLERKTSVAGSILQQYQTNRKLDSSGDEAAEAEPEKGEEQPVSHSTKMPGKSSSTTVSEEKSGSRIRRDGALGDLVAAEESAPWNQYAWREELELRLAGGVEFGAELEPARFWRRLVHGDTFRQTVWSRRRHWFDPWDRHGGVDGGDPAFMASHKPHAVIANGAALQRVPNALRWLQRTCRRHDVPLFVIRDPRSYVAKDDDDDLGRVLRDVRRTVKNRIVTKALHHQHQAGSSFRRGWWMGKLQADAQWRAWSVTRSASETLRRAEEKKKLHEEIEREVSWKDLDETALEERLAARGVIEKAAGADGETAAIDRSYSPGLMALARRCVAESEEEENLASGDED